VSGLRISVSTLIASSYLIIWHLSGGAFISLLAFLQQTLIKHFDALEVIITIVTIMFVYLKV